MKYIKRSVILLAILLSYTFSVSYAFRYLFTSEKHHVYSGLKITSTILGDLNNDGVVDSTDLGILGNSWGSFKGEVNYVSEADINNDGAVDSSDLGIMGAHWGETE